VQHVAKRLGLKHLFCDPTIVERKALGIHKDRDLREEHYGIDTAAKGHKMLSGFKGIMNEFYLDDLREKTSRGMIGQALKGFHCGGRAYGYRLVPELDARKTDPYGQPAWIGTDWKSFRSKPNGSGGFSSDMRMAGRRSRLWKS